ncbi:MAG TPA: M91 family zinc metallopeptidase, partial [Nitrososphaeraceae archaeon]|nr:M91 family zinc metallopeptidase [Nitrososphaeraceae archaeon]
DPLADKYPGWSPYNYCLNNPVNLVDPDGRKIVFAQGTSESFKKIFWKTVEYLKSKDALGPLKDVIENQKYTITLASPNNSNENNIFHPGKNMIIWNPSLAMETSNGKSLSPSTMLVHESDHAKQRNTKTKEYFEAKNEKDKSYDNLEEKRVIDGSERETAEKLGEINENENTRTDHEGWYFNVDDPTKNK